MTLQLTIASCDQWLQGGPVPTINGFMGPLTTLLIGVITSFITIIGAHLVTILKKEWTKSWNLKVFHPKGKGETWTHTTNFWVPAVSFFGGVKLGFACLVVGKKSKNISPMVVSCWFNPVQIRNKNHLIQIRNKAMSMYKSLGHNAPPAMVSPTFSTFHTFHVRKSWRSSLHITNWASLLYTWIWRRCLEQNSKHLLPHGGEP